jgi:hypothetical protein
VDELSARLEKHTILRGEFEEHVRSDERALEAIQHEIGIQRSNIAKIFDQMRDMEQTAHGRHVELVKAIGSMKT